MSDSTTPPLEELDKYRAAFGLLAEDGENKIRVSKFLDFVKAAFGDVYDEEAIEALSQGLGPDENGLVDFDSFMKLFSSDRLCPEAKKEVCNAFAQNPDLCSLADWSGALAKLGLNLSKEDVDRVMQHAVKSAVELLKKDLQERSSNEETSSSSSEEESEDDEPATPLEQAVEKLHLGDSGDEKDGKQGGDPSKQGGDPATCSTSKVEPVEHAAEPANVEKNA